MFSHPALANKNPEFVGSVSQVSKQVIQRGSIISNMKNKKKLFECKQSGNPSPNLEPESESDIDEDDDIKKQIFMNQKLEGTEVIDKFYAKCADDLTNPDAGIQTID